MSSISRVQALGVETVGGIEELEIGLVEIGDGDGFQLEAVLRQRLSGGRLDAGDIFPALLVHLLHGHLGGDGTEGRHELTRKKRVQPLGLECAPAERRGGDRHRLASRLHADIEVSLDIDAHPIAGDQGAALLPHDLHR